MASRPDLTSFRVDPQGVGQPALRPAGARDFAGEQQQQLGASLGRAGAELDRIHLEQLREANALVLNEAITKAKEAELQLTYGDGGFTKLRGREATFRPGDKTLADDYGSRYETVLDEIGGTLRNDAQRAEFTRFRQDTMVRFRESAMRHADREYGTWAKSNISGSIELLASQAVLGREDPEAVADSFGGIDAHVAELARLQGTSANEVDALQRKAIGGAVVGAVKGFIEDGKVFTAEQFLNTHRSRMDAATITQASQLLDGEVNFRMAMTAADEAVNGASADAVGNATETLLAPVRTGVTVSSPYGVRSDPVSGELKTHGGLDLVVPAGTAVSASGSGVATVKRDPGGYGLYVEVDHGGGLVTRYAHLGSTDKAVGESWEVRQGEVIARSGSSGKSTGPHLHYEVRKDGKTVDPNATYKSAGGRFGGPSTPAQTLEEARRRIMADPRLQGDQRRVQAALQEAARIFSIRDSDRARAEREGNNAAWRWYMENQQATVADMPASIRNGASPQTALAIMKAMTTEKKVDDTSSAVASIEIEGMILDGRISSPEELFAVSNNVNPTDLRRLGKTLLGVQNKNTGDITALTSSNKLFRDMRAEIEAAGLGVGSAKAWKKNGEAYAALQASVYRGLLDAETQLGRKLTEDEQRNIFLSRIGETAIKQGHWFNRSKLRGFEVGYEDIPEADRLGIVQELQSVTGVQPTRQQVLETYLRGAREGGR